MGFLEIKELKTLQKGIPDDLFITCVSFEERCIKSLLFSEYYSAKNIIVFDYSETERKKETIRRERNRKMILEKAKDLVKDQKKIFLIDCFRSDPRDGYYRFLEICRLLEFSSVSNNLAITFDISVFTKSYLLILLKAFEHLRKKRIRIIYTEPAFYYPERQTLGVKSIGYIPFFNGNITPLKPNLLFIFCGFEGERAYAVWEYAEPEKTIAFIGNPGFQPNYPEVTRQLNQSLISNLEREIGKGNEIMEVSARDPDDVCNKLGSLWKKNQDYNILISPLGNKTQALGIYLFIQKNPSANAQIIYASPQHYFEDYYAKGSNRMFQYDINFK